MTIEELRAALGISGGHHYWRRILWLVLLGGCIFAGADSLSWRHQLVSSHTAADAGLPALFANGSTPVTALSCWLAAAAFALAAWNVRRRAPEPPLFASHTADVGSWRAALRREYRMTRIVLWGVLAVTIFDVCRALRDSIAFGDSLATSPLRWTWIEATGLLAATLFLAWWSVQFRRQLLQLGAIS